MQWEDCPEYLQTSSKQYKIKIALSKIKQICKLAIAFILSDVSNSPDWSLNFRSLCNFVCILIHQKD
jgi:hypothetical protein